MTLAELSYTFFQSPYSDGCGLYYRRNNRKYPWNGLLMAGWISNGATLITASIQ